MCFGCSKEPSHQDGSFEYPQHMFRLRNKKNNFQYHTLGACIHYLIILCPCPPCCIREIIDVTFWIYTFWFESLYFKSFNIRDTPCNENITSVCQPMYLILWIKKSQFNIVLKKYAYTRLMLRVGNLIFLFLNQNICCGCSKEPYQ